MIEPRTFKGTRDFLPSEQAPREALIERLKTVFRAYGFAPLETPAMELMEILHGKYGEEGEKLIFKLAYKDGNTLALRYDLTVPLARVVAMHPHLPRPFKRYQVQPVWRAEAHQIRQGRFREFMQCDVDTIGATSLLADAEIIAVAHDSLRAIGFGDDTRVYDESGNVTSGSDRRFCIRINHRAALAGMCEWANLAGDEVEVCREIDKWDKIGEQGVRDGLKAVLRAKREGPPTEEGVFVPVDVMTAVTTNVDRLVDAVGTWSASSTLDPRWLEMLEQTERGHNGLSELVELAEHLRAFGLDANSYAFDPRVARGLDYYTGTIYESVALGAPHIGSLTGGGRYDNLIGLFANQTVPAVGTTVGLDRILSAMEALGMSVDAPSAAEVMVTLFDKDGLAYGIALAQQVRAMGRRVELSYRVGALGKQLELCSKKGIPIALVAGPDERASGEITVRDLRASSQEKVARVDLAGVLTRLLG